MVYLEMFSSDFQILDYLKARLLSQQSLKASNCPHCQRCGNVIVDRLEASPMCCSVDCLWVFVDRLVVEEGKGSGASNRDSRFEDIN